MTTYHGNIEHDHILSSTHLGTAVGGAHAWRWKYWLGPYLLIAYFYSVTVEKWLVVSLPNFVTMRKAHLSISCKIFSWIRTTKLKDTRHGILRFYKGFCSPEWFICTSLTDHDKHLAAKADSSLSNRRASLSRSLATDVSVDSQIGSGNGLVPDGTKPLLEPMFIYDQWGAVTITWE